jgi:hypothetical protein
MRVSQDKCCIPCDCVSFSDHVYAIIVYEIEKNLVAALNLTQGGWGKDLGFFLPFSRFD